MALNLLQLSSASLREPVYPCIRGVVVDFAGTNTSPRSSSIGKSGALTIWVSKRACNSSAQTNHVCR
jgi:hypothetical protein